MRPRAVWLAFGLCLAVLAGAMAWSTAIAVRLERTDSSARAAAALEENTRLALWRLDSAVTPLLAQESVRPYFHYGAYYDAGAAYARMHDAASAASTASPLLRETPPTVRLHFQVAPGGAVTSPEVPTGRWRARALRERETTEARLAEGEQRLSEVRGLVAEASVWRVVADQAVPKPATRVALATPTPPVRLAQDALPKDALLPQKMKSVREFEQRQQSFEQNRSALNTVSNQGAVLPNVNDLSVFAEPAPLSRVVPAAPPGIVEEAAVAPLWVGDQLILTRQIRVDGTLYGQGCWLDWPALRAQLLGTITDLLPGASLEAMPGPAANDERRLATLPVRLVPGALAPPPESFSVVRLSLAGAWAGLLVSALAVALLLRAVMALSERRRVFVSAVTHELRTPLTTFRLYTDMMAEGMVPSEEKRTEYLGRLRAEAQRLGHLVENVLAYARLENRRATAVRESVDLRALGGDVASRAADRAAAAGLAIVVEPGPPVRARVDASIVEQVLVNLLDNACKYARPADPPTVDIAVELAGKSVRVLVRDHGPGLSDVARRRLFEPFSKSDHEAAATAPGLGLGLALCRSLARDQGGDLALEPGGPGASFVLTLPADS